MSVLIQAWNWQPTVLGGGVALGAGYALWLRRAAPGPGPLRIGAFTAGLLTLLLALVSPLDALSDSYLFSAHMLQHMLLLLVVPPLLLLGLPRPGGASWHGQWVCWLERTLTRTRVALPLQLVLLYAWHLPALFDWTLRSEPIHVAEHLSFLVSATLYWWPFYGPGSEAVRLPHLLRVASLALAALFTGILGAAISFAPNVLYQGYLAPDDRLGLLKVVRGSWGISPRTDQELAGLLMWVLGGVFYLLMIGRTFLRWFADQATAEGSASGQSRGGAVAWETRPVVDARTGSGQ